MLFLGNFALENKKKILILSCEGGGGHTAVAQALDEYLSDEFEVAIFSDFFYGLLQPQYLRSNRISGEKIYNYFLVNKWYRTINWYYKAGIWFFNTLTHTKSLKKIKNYLIEHKPDLVISVIPLANNLILEAAQSLNIPFLLIPTDLDIRTFIAKIKSPSYKSFKLALAHETPAANKALNKAHIPPMAIEKTGFVIRKNFFEHKDVPAIKREYNVPEGKPVILLLLGAVGVERIVDFTQEIMHINTSAHLLICIGRNESLQAQIQALNFPPHISYTIIGFTNKISDLMAIADVFITKSGSVSVNEGLHMNLPMILDATGPLLTWEEKNHFFVTDHMLGISLKNIHDLPQILDDWLSDQKKLLHYKNNLLKLEKKSAGEQIKKLVRKMLAHDH